MPRRFSTAEVEAALRRIGFQRTRQRGSHMRLTGFWRGTTHNVTLLAVEKVIPARRLSSILRQAGLSADELLRLVNGEDVAQ